MTVKNDQVDDCKRKYGIGCGLRGSIENSLANLILLKYINFYFRNFLKFASYLVFSAALVYPMSASAQLYRFYMEPYGQGMTTDPGACSPQGQKWYSTIEAACQALTGVQPECDRNTAVYSNDVATLEGSTCSLTWNYVNLSGVPGGTWSASLGASFCPLGFMIAPDNTTCVPILDKNQDRNYCPSQLAVGDPIYPLTGTRNQSELIGAWGGPQSALPMLQMVYETRAQLLGADRTAPFFAAPVNTFGPFWGANILTNLVANAGSSSVSISRGNGKWATFISSSGGYQSTTDPQNSLAANSSGWLFKDGEGEKMEQYSQAGQLDSVHLFDGKVLNFTYGANSAGNPAVTVSDQFGRSVSMNYGLYGAGSSSAVSSVIDPAGLSVLVSYSNSGQVTSLKWSDGSSRTYLYERSDLPWALTGVIDENGTRLSTYSYDNQGYVSGTSLAGGVDLYSISYATPPQIDVSYIYDPVRQVYYRVVAWIPPQGLVLTLPNGSTSAVTSASVQGLSALSGQTQSAGSGCAASSNSQSYDSNGYLASKTDFNGFMSCFLNDPSSGLVLTEVNGLAGGTACSTVMALGTALPGGSSAKSKRWHPLWPLPVEVAEPGKLTTNVYNGQPDPFNGNAVASCAPASAVLPDGSPIAVLCKKVEQATTDSNGSQGFGAALNSNVPNKIWSWTYNAQGQRLSATDPRGNTSTYSYYATTVAGTATQGDLQSVANAQGQITQYTQYDPYGNLLQSVDPNGVTTTNTYDARQRLTSTSVGGQATGYQYDLAGQLIKVTQPDGASMKLSYDPAHRLVGVSDSLGNSVSYTLDNAGNRIAEQVSDANGRLSTQLSRVFDALNRNQQTTGME